MIPFSDVKPISLVDLSIFISPQSDALMAVLKGYFDDSEKKGDTCSLAGYVGSVEAWTNFDDNWRKKLKDYGVAYLHMREFAHSVEEFKGWDKDEEKRKRFLRELIGVISSSNLHGIGAVIFLDDVKRVNSERGRNIEAYPFNLFACMIELSMLYPQDVFGLILDRVNKCESKIEKAMAYAESDKYYPQCGEKISLMCLQKKGISFKDIPGIQAADLAAYEFYLNYSRQKPWFQAEKSTVKSEWMISNIFWNSVRNWTLHDKKRKQKSWPYQRKSLAHLSMEIDIEGKVWDYAALCGVDAAREGIWP